MEGCARISEVATPEDRLFEAFHSGGNEHRDAPLTMGACRILWQSLEMGATILYPTERLAPGDGDSVRAQVYIARLAKAMGHQAPGRV